MTKHWGALLAVTFSAVLFFCGVAAAAEWRVAKLSGHVAIQSGLMQGVSLTNGMILKGGSVLVTDSTGRALLVHGRDQMIISPGSMVALPKDGAGMTTVIQRFGESELDVRHRSNPHFVVTTPYLTAVVKGTHFKVRVFARGASVVVKWGIVEVHDLHTGEKADVATGQTALVSHGHHLKVIGRAALAPILQDEPRAAPGSPFSGGITAGVAGSVSGARTSGGVTGGGVTSGGDAAVSAAADGNVGAANDAGCSGGCVNGNGGNGNGGGDGNMLPDFVPLPSAPFQWPSPFK